MPNAIDVVTKAKRWKNTEVAFDDGDFSVVKGEYRHDDGTWRSTMGVRWNGTDGVGYPKLFGNPVFFVVPTWMEESIFRSIEKNLNA